LGADLGELFDTAGLLPGDWLTEEFDDEDDDGASLWGGGPAWDTGRGGGSGGAGAGPRGGGAGGAGLDAAAAMVFRPRRLRALKKRYDQLLRVSLAVQNRIDDIASICERLTAMAGGHDSLAAALFYGRLLAAAAAAAAFGARRAAFAWWCWEALRPPGWRAPPGIRGPLQFLNNLPSRSTEE
jgi:hypothetical protein